MQPIRKALKLDKTSYYEAHLSFINCVLPVKLTVTEIRVLAAFMRLEGDIAEDRFGVTARKMVMKGLKLSSPALSNHLASLIKKDFIRHDSGGPVRIQPILIPEPFEQDYTFKIIRIDQDEVVEA